MPRDSRIPPRPKETVPSDSLFVGNIPYETGRQELEEVFQNVAAPIYAAESRHRDGRARGFGLVRFATIEDAQRVLDLHTTRPFSLGGRTLNLEWTAPRTVDPERRAPPSKRVFYHGTFLPESELRVAFGEHADEITNWLTLPNKRGFIEFTSIDTAQAAINELDGKIIEGNPIYLQFAWPRNDEQQRRQDENRSRGNYGYRDYGRDENRSRGNFGSRDYGQQKRSRWERNASRGNFGQRD